MNTRVLPENTSEDFEFDYIDIASVSRNLGISSTAHLRFGDAPSRARRVVREGDVIVSTVRTYLRAVAPVTWEYDGAVCSTGFAVLSPTKAVEHRFLRYVASERHFVEEVVARSAGVSYPAIPAGDLVRISVPAPPWTVQQAIADFLDAECSRIMELSRTLESHRASTAELDRRFLDDLFGELPLTRLGWRTHVQTGLTLGTPHRGELVERPYLRVANVQSERIDTHDLATVSVPPNIVDRFMLRAGDVLMTEGGDIDKLGRGAVWDGRIPACLHQNHVFAVRCGPEVEPELLALWTRGSTARSYFERTASRITNIASTNLTKLLRLPVPDLPLVEQRQLLGAYRDHEARTATLRELANGLQHSLAEYRDSLITEAVTGKLDVGSLSERRLDESVHAAMEGEAPEVLSA